MMGLVMVLFVRTISVVGSDQDALFSSGFSESLPQIPERWAELLGGNGGLPRVNQRLKETRDAPTSISHTDAQGHP